MPLLREIDLDELTDRLKGGVILQDDLKDGELAHVDFHDDHHQDNHGDQS